MLKVGLSGKIASGKSEVEKIFSNLGYLVFDLDEISRVCFNQKEDEIVRVFQTLDRKKIADVIFKDESKKQELEAILYPKIKKEILNLFEKYKNEKAIVISGALLFKSGFYKLFDKNIFVEANENIRLQRLMKRNNLSLDEAKNRINAQDDSDLADFIIENNSDLKTLQKQVEIFISTF